MSSSDSALANRDGIPVPKRPAWKTVRDLLPYMWLENRWDLRWRVIASFLLLFAGRGLGLFVPFVYKDIIDSLSGGETTQTLLLLSPVFLILAYGSVEILITVVYQVSGLLRFRVAIAMERTLSIRGFDHLNQLSLGFHHLRRTAVLSEIVGRGAAYADFLLSMVLFELLPMGFLFIALLWILLANFGWLYTGVIFLTALSYLAFTLWLVEIRKHRHRADIKARDEKWATFYDAMDHMDAVKNFANERFEYGRYDQAAGTWEAKRLHNESAYVLTMTGQMAIRYIGLITVMIMTALEVMDGKMTVGDVVLIVSLLGQFYFPLDRLGFVYRYFRTALVDSEHYLALMAMEPDIKDRPGAKPLKVTRGEIRFESVGFAYDNDKPVLRGISFTAAPGQKVGIVGRTGAGKSTIAKLLYRHFEVGSGRILIDGQDIRNVTQESLRQAIGIVPQETALFNHSIAYNISYGRPGASMDEIVAAAKLARVHDSIMARKDGYDAIVGEDGLQMSGGERQRIAIARAVIGNPQILILDEATSSLDTQTEAAIQSAFEEAARDRTTIMIAHRLSTLVHADTILVLKDGQIAEQGDHETLLGWNGLYADMWRQQNRAYKK